MIHAQRHVNVVESCKFSPIASVKAVSFLLAEEKAAAVCVRVTRYSPAEVAGTLGVASVISFNKMHFNGWPDDVLVKT